MKTYKQLIRLNSFEERFRYLHIGRSVGEVTFGSKRFMNQVLYTSEKWQDLRAEILQRDGYRDLAMIGYEVTDRFLVHHINPITIDDVVNERQKVFDKNNLITTTLNTHNCIHYGRITDFDNILAVRTYNDTCPWK